MVTLAGRVNEQHRFGHILGAQAFTTCDFGFDFSGRAITPKFVEHGTRCHGSHPHIVWRHLPPKAMNKRLNGVLGSRIYRLPLDGLMAGNRTRDNDVPRFAFDHLG